MRSLAGLVFGAAGTLSEAEILDRAYRRGAVLVEVGPPETRQGSQGVMEGLPKAIAFAGGVNEGVTKSEFGMEGRAEVSGRGHCVSSGSL